MKIRPIIISTIVGFGILGAIYGINNSIKSQNKQNKINMQKAETILADSQRPIKIEVLEELYTNQLNKVPEKYVPGLLSTGYSNETVKLDSRYIIKGRTDEGKTIAVSIIDGPDKHKESLDMLVNKGTILEFPQGNLIPPIVDSVLNVAQPYKEFEGYLFSGLVEGETYFNENTQFGNKRADRVKVIKY